MKTDNDEISFDFGPPFRLGAILFSCLGMYLLVHSGWRVLLIQQRSLPIFIWPIIIIFFLIMLCTLWRNIFYRDRLVVQRIPATLHRRAAIIQCDDITGATVEHPPLYQSAPWALDWFGFGKGLLVVHTKQGKFVFGPGIGYDEALDYQRQILAFCNADPAIRHRVGL